MRHSGGENSDSAAQLGRFGHQTPGNLRVGSGVESVVNKFLPVAAMALVLAGCSSSGHTSNQPATSTTTTTVSTTTAPGGTGTSATSGTIPTTGTAAGPPTCGASALSLTLSPPLGSAGALHYELVFTNSSASTCTLYGFPGVSFLDQAGHQIGPASQRGNAAPRQLVTLAPAGRAYATLDVTDPGIPPCTGGATVSAIRVYPPGSLASLRVVPTPQMQVCPSANTSNYVATTVGPVSVASSSG